MMAFELAPGMRTYLRLVFRGLQLVCCLLALVFTATGFRTYGYSEWSVTLGSPATTFNLLMTYSGAVYAAVQLVAVDALRLFPRMQRPHEVVVDVALALLLLAAGIAMAASSLISSCDRYYGNYSGALRCGCLTAATVFSFLSAVCFTLTVGLAFTGTAQGPATPATGGAVPVDAATVETGVPLYHAQASPAGSSNL